MKMDAFDIARLTRDAVKKGYLTSEDRQAILENPEENADNILLIQEKLKGDSWFGKVREGATNVFGGLGRHVGAGGVSLPIWAVIAVVIILALNGVEGVANLFKVDAKDVAKTVQGTKTAVSIDKSQWIEAPAGVFWPVNKLPFKQVPFTDAETRAKIAVGLILIMLLPGFVDNNLPRTNQQPNVRGNVGAVTVILGAMLWGYWPLVIVIFGAILCIRSRAGNKTSSLTALVILILGLWLWFDKISPLVTGWLDVMALNPNLSWLVDILTWLFDGENSRPLALVALVGIMIWSVMSQGHDSSTLLLVIATVVAWRFIFGVWLFLESVPAGSWGDATIFWILYVLVLGGLFLEQSQVGVPLVWGGVLLLFGIGYCVTYTARGIFQIDPEANTVARWLTQPMIFGYGLLLTLSLLFNKWVVGKSKLFDGFYKLFGNWLGNLVPVGPFQLPVDAIYMANWIVVGLLLKTSVPLI